MILEQRADAQAHKVRDMYTLKNENTACCFVDQEAVMINTETSAYYSLNQTGSFVLRELIGSGRSVAEIASDMQNHFGMDQAGLESDIHHVIGRLETDGLISKSEDETQSPAPIDGGDDVELPSIYEKPLLERHGELEQLILSGE